MIFTCLSTGSDGNAYLLESENIVLIIEAGKGTFKKIIAAVPEGKKVVGVIYSHQHNDHFGDVEKIGKMFDVLKFDELNRFENDEFKIKRFPVLHNVECFGFWILCKAENKTFMFITDFVHVLNKSIYNLKIDFLAIELSYNQFILPKLTSEQKIGLEWHSSDFHTVEIIQKYFNFNKNLKVVTIHGSKRACNTQYTNIEVLYKKFGLRASIVGLGKKYIF